MLTEIVALQSSAFLCVVLRGHTPFCKRGKGSGNFCCSCLLHRISFTSHCISTKAADKAAAACGFTVDLHLVIPIEVVITALMWQNTVLWMVTHCTEHHKITRLLSFLRNGVATWDYSLWRLWDVAIEMLHMKVCLVKVWSQTIRTYSANDFTATHGFLYSCFFSILFSPLPSPSLHLSFSIFFSLPYAEE